MSVEYSQHYYDSLTASARRSTEVIVPLVIELLSPASVMDVGCGAGAWLAEFQRRGVPDIFGVDGPWVASQQLQIPLQSFRVADLTQPLRESRRFDLAICLEVAEHLPATYADTLVSSLVSLSDAILFSAAIPCQGGENHFNEQWPDYWTEKFEAQGSHVIDALRPALWRNPQVEYWYAQNILLFVRSSKLEENQSLRVLATQTRRDQLALVHPRAFLEGSVRAKRPYDLLQAILGAVKRGLKKKLGR